MDMASRNRHYDWRDNAKKQKMSKKTRAPEATEDAAEVMEHLEARKQAMGERAADLNSAAESEIPSASLKHVDLPPQHAHEQRGSEEMQHDESGSTVPKAWVQSLAADDIPAKQSLERELAEKAAKLGDVKRKNVEQQQTEQRNAKEDEEAVFRAADAMCAAPQTPTEAAGAPQTPTEAIAVFSAAHLAKCDPAEQTVAPQTPAGMLQSPDRMDMEEMVEVDGGEVEGTSVEMEGGSVEALDVEEAALDVEEAENTMDFRKHPLTSYGSLPTMPQGLTLAQQNTCLFQRLLAWGAFTTEQQHFLEPIIGDSLA